MKTKNISELTQSQKDILLDSQKLSQQAIYYEPSSSTSHLLHSVFTFILAVYSGWMVLQSQNVFLSIPFYIALSVFLFITSRTFLASLVVIGVCVYLFAPLELVLPYISNYLAPLQEVLSQYSPRSYSLAVLIIMLLWFFKEIFLLHRFKKAELPPCRFLTPLQVVVVLPTKIQVWDLWQQEQTNIQQFQFVSKPHEPTLHCIIHIEKAKINFFVVKDSEDEIALRNFFGFHQNHSGAKEHYGNFATIEVF